MDDYRNKREKKYKIYFKKVYDGLGPIIHEHVIERKKIVEKIIKNKKDIKKILTVAIACLVTKDEHSQLSKINDNGWNRYKKAKIKVFDRLKGKWIL